MSVLRTSIILLATALSVVVSCASCGQDSPANAPSRANGPGCGVAVFASPACQAPLDETCCAEQIECSRDIVCDRFVRCRFGCKSARAFDECSNGCLVPLVQQFGEDAMRAGMTKFGLVGQCSKSLPSKGMQCVDSS